MVEFALQYVLKLNEAVHMLLLQELLRTLEWLV